MRYFNLLTIIQSSIKSSDVYVRPWRQHILHEPQLTQAEQLGIGKCVPN